MGDGWDEISQMEERLAEELRHVESPEDASPLGGQRVALAACIFVCASRGVMISGLEAATAMILEKGGQRVQSLEVSRHPSYTLGRAGKIVVPDESVSRVHAARSCEKPEQ